DGLLVTPPMLLLAFLLVAAGLGTKLDQLKHLARRPGVLLTALGANAVYPLLFTASLAFVLQPWPNADEAQNILVGLALIGAMPIAGASTAWAQNADGNLALSLGLVLGSTLLSPLVTPVGLHAIGLVTHGDYSEDLHELAREGSSTFVLWMVL